MARPDSIMPQNHVNTHIRTAAGSPEMNVNGSVTPVEFFFIPDYEYRHARYNINIIDNVAVNADEFGGLSALSNGILFDVTFPDGRVIDLLDGLPITMNGEFASRAGVDVTQLAGNRGIGVRWSPSRATEGANLKYPAGSSFKLTVQDNLTGLVQFRMAFQGYYVRGAEEI